MNALQNIEDVFAILHDGFIVAFEGTFLNLVLDIQCQYLAERINPNFENFFVELIDIKTLEFEIWPNPISLPKIVMREPEEIFTAELEILSASIIDGCVQVTCNQHDLSYDYCGGNLLVNCNAIKMYDQDKNELTIDFMDKVCNDYWNRGKDD